MRGRLKSGHDTVIPLKGDVANGGWFSGVLTLLTALAIGQADAALADIAFEDRSATLPTAHVYDGGWTHFVGGGVAVFDCNADSRPDVFAAGGSNAARLFVNSSRAGGDIAFEEGAISEIVAATGAYPLDVNSDGILDLVVLRNGENLLLQGKADCRFSPAPPSWGFDGGSEWTTSFTATFETGQDWPTLAFGNYVDQTNPDGPFEACDRNYLMRPNGTAFLDRIALEPGFCALSMLISDWQRNGTPDLRISNDRQYYVRDGREQMWRLDPLKEYGAADGWPVMKLWGMGIASRDLTGDGLPEVVLTSMGDQPLQINQGGGVMTNAPYSIGSYASTPYIGDDGRPSTGWHAGFGDVDNDGRDDIFIAKGNVDQMPSNAIHDPNNLLIQQPDGTFFEMGAATGVGTTERSRGAALADLNGDGRLDILVVNRRAPMEVWQNTSDTRGHWLALDLRQSGANTRAVGAFVELRLPSGHTMTREHTVGGGHASGIAGPMHFGLGDASKAFIRVIWPDGGTSDWTEVEAGRIVTVGRGTGSALRLTKD